MKRVPRGPFFFARISFLSFRICRFYPGLWTVDCCQLSKLNKDLYGLSKRILIDFFMYALIFMRTRTRAYKRK